MIDPLILADVSAINQLANKLDHYKCVRRFDVEGESQAGVIAHTFSDLEESFRRVARELLPRLVSEELSEQEACGILRDIGEEFRHIQYHVRDCRFYSYLRE